MKITQHPNGFLRVEFFKLPTGESDRIHVWDKPGLMDGLDIHQHEADFESRLDSGVMREDLYEYREDPEGQYERWSVVCYTDGEGKYHVDPGPGKIRVTPVLTRTLIHEAGETYTRPAADFHLVTALEVPLVTRSTTGAAYMRRHYFLRRLVTVPA